MENSSKNQASPSKARASKLGCFVSIIGIVLLILLSLYNREQRMDTNELFRPHISEFKELKDVTVRSNIRTHKGNVVLIDYEKEALSGFFLYEIGILSGFGQPKGLIAKTPEQVKTLVFLKDIPKSTAIYSGGIWLSSLDKREDMEYDPLWKCYQMNNGAINTYAEVIELRIVDRLSRELIKTITFNSLDDDPLPKSANCCLKRLNTYWFSNDHTDAIFYKNQQSCGLLFRFSETGKRKRIWESIRSYYDSR